MAAKIQRRVLVVEDNVVLTMSLVELLQSNNYAIVGPTADLAATARLASEEQIDIALLDVSLHGETTEPIARMLAQRGIPVLLVTGHSRKYVRRHFGETPSIEKPFSASDLCGRIASMIASDEKDNMPER